MNAFIWPADRGRLEGVRVEEALWQPSQGPPMCAKSLVQLHQFCRVVWRAYLWRSFTTQNASIKAASFFYWFRSLSCFLPQKVFVVSYAHMAELVDLQQSAQEKCLKHGKSGWDFWFICADYSRIDWLYGFACLHEFEDVTLFPPRGIK